MPGGVRHSILIYTFHLLVPDSLSLDERRRYAVEKPQNRALKGDAFHPGLQMLENSNIGLCCREVLTNMPRGIRIGLAYKERHGLVPSMELELVFHSIIILLSLFCSLLFLLYTLNTIDNFLFVLISSYTISTIAFLLFGIWSAESWNTRLILFEFTFLCFLI